METKPLQVNPRKVYRIFESFERDTAPFRPPLSQTAILPLEDGSLRVMIGPNTLCALITLFLVPFNIFRCGLEETFSSLWKILMVKSYLFVDIPEDDDLYDEFADLYEAAFKHNNLYLR